MTWPNHLSRFCFTTSVNVFFIRRALLTCLFLSVTPRMALRQRISNTSSLRVSLDQMVHVSDANVAIGIIRALYRAKHIDFLFQMASISRPNAADASLIRLIT